MSIYIYILFFKFVVILILSIYLLSSFNIIIINILLVGVVVLYCMPLMNTYIENIYWIEYRRLLVLKCDDVFILENVHI